MVCQIICFFLGFFKLGQISENRKIIFTSILITNRTNTHPLCNMLAIRESVDDLACPMPFIFNGFPHRLIKLFMMNSRWEYAWIFPKNIRFTVTIDLSKTTVYFYDIVIIICNDDAFIRIFHWLRENLHSFFIVCVFQHDCDNVCSCL